MPDPRPDVMEFLLTRRSRPAKTLTGPVPSRSDLGPILTAAARSPDHGKLEPWRFLVLEKPALTRLAKLVKTRVKALNIPLEKQDKAVSQFSDAGLVIAIVAAPIISEKVPEIEQLMSAGAVCLALVNAALASGWGANWLTGVMARDAEFLHLGLGLTPNEFVAGFIHLGTETSPPPERPRPDIDAKTTWVSE